MESTVHDLFTRYEQAFTLALAGTSRMDDIATLYASDFIAASPSGVMSGKNDARFRQAMAQGYERYRDIGTKAMRIRQVAVSCIDEHHCIAHVAWTATYARPNLPQTAVDFDVHYLVQVLNGEAKVFGWITGDEQAVLKRHGIL